MPGTVGVVIGATLGAVGFDRPARRRRPGPGFGVQGGTATVRALFAGRAPGDGTAQRIARCCRPAPTSRPCATQRPGVRGAATGAPPHGPTPGRLPVGGGQVLGERRNGRAGGSRPGRRPGRRTSRRRRRWTRRRSRPCRSVRALRPRRRPVARRSTPAGAAFHVAQADPADEAVDAAVGGGAHPAGRSCSGAARRRWRRRRRRPSRRRARIRAGWPKRWMPPWARSFMAHSGLAGTVPSGSSSSRGVASSGAVTGKVQSLGPLLEVELAVGPRLEGAVALVGPRCRSRAAPSRRGGAVRPRYRGPHRATPPAGRSVGRPGGRHRRVVRCPPRWGTTRSPGPPPPGGRGGPVDGVGRPDRGEGHLVAGGQLADRGRSTVATQATTG